MTNLLDRDDVLYAFTYLDITNRKWDWTGEVVLLEVQAHSCAEADSLFEAKYGYDPRKAKNVVFTVEIVH